MEPITYSSWGRIVGACMTILLISCSIMMGCDDDENLSEKKPYLISGEANGSHMVPSVSGTGSATISGAYSPETHQLNYTSNWKGLTGPPTSGGFYDGASGVSGTAVGSTWALDSVEATGTTSGMIMLNDDQVKQLLDGEWYYTLGTAANPNGEVRGQITTTRAQ